MIPTLVVAGTHSGVGKTSVATALLAALARRGLRAQPFKVGPDFIDPGFHAAATGRPSHNLDGWMFSRADNSALFLAAASGADVAVVEGMMGLFDGAGGATEAGSTAELAKWLGAPVILVADASALARSGAAIVRGFETLDPDLDLAGVLFNRVAGAGHYRLLADAVRAHCRALPLGFLKADPGVALPERHLGLVTAPEVLHRDRLERLADWLEASVDVDALIGLARSRTRGPGHETAAPRHRPAPRAQARIGIARDRAFCFYYQDNLDALEAAGAELVEFSPIADRRVPERLDGIYLGGGYPELEAAALSENRSLLAELAELARSGVPVYAECGGFMVLTEAIVDEEGRSFPMVGLFPTRARLSRRLSAIGYVEIEALADTAGLGAGERARGHEFRHSTIDPMPQWVPRRYRVTTRPAGPTDGYALGNVLGSYIHLHFRSCPTFAARFVAACARERREQTTDVPEGWGKRGSTPPLPTQL